MMANPPGTLLFDLDGTLVDSAGDLSGSLDTLMAEKDLSPIGIATGRQLIGHGIANLVRNALKLRGESEDEGDIAIDLARFMDIYASRLTRLTRPYPGVVETLEVLKSQGWSMGVCTNKREKFATSIVEDLGLSRFFEVVSGPDTFGVGKPDPRQLSEMVKAAGGRHPALFVGDSEVDVAAAKAAGMPVIALTYGYSKIPLDTLAPDALLSSFGDVPQAISEIMSKSR
ncbi:MAG: HAD family hydrolase [Aestuariivirga sp.]|uniref:HAD family hydrolase n=1 Tax=Aestuariivirga sp. TaxID=2650926 RepID=UPI00301933D8